MPTRRKHEQRKFKIWLLVFSCPITTAVNTQVTLASGSDEFAEACTRFFCECGIPLKMWVDRDSAFFKMCDNITFFLQSVEGHLSHQYKMPTELCPVSGHNFHGRVERVGRTYQDTLVRTGLDKVHLHPLSWQTACKLFDNMYSS